MELSEQGNGQKVQLTAGQAFTLLLPENPSTGYTWQLRKKGEPAAQLLSDAFEPGRSVPGAPGVHRWQFRAGIAESTGTILLELVRPWESVSASRTYSVTLRVSK
jgi:inhibitor of cysteine peptidase